MSTMDERQIEELLTRVERCLGEERPKDAIPDLQQLLAVLPNHPRVLCDVGRISIQLGDNPAALHALDLALSQQPDNLEALNARGVAYQNLDRLEDAERDFRLVCEQVGDNPGACLNLGSVLAAKGAFGESEEWFEKALQASPDNPTASYNLGLVRLVTGRLTQGWPGFERRSRADNVGLARGRSDRPRWSGEALPDATLLIQAEQGLGDNIQFVRYAAMARGRVARVIVETPKPLVDLVGGVEGVDAVVGRGDPLPEHDVFIPVMSLPAVFETEVETIPWSGPYIEVPEDRTAYWCKRLSTMGRGLHVGLVWAGNPSHKRDRQRSIPLSTLAPLTEVPGVALHALQIGPALAQLDDVSFGRKIRPLFRKERPFPEVAAVMSALDLIIGVDTSLVHLAGAMGRPVWTMVTAVPDWRWMLARADTPWYPSMRLYRQPNAGDWQSVADSVAADLKDFAAGQE